MNRMKLLVLSALAAIMILGSSLALASQPADDHEGAGPVIGGGIGRNLKR